MTIKPLGDRILIKEIKKVQDEKINGIIVPTNIPTDIRVVEGEVIDSNVNEIQISSIVIYQPYDLIKVDTDKGLLKKEAVLAIRT